MTLNISSLPFRKLGPLTLDIIMNNICLKASFTANVVEQISVFVVLYLCRNYQFYPYLKLSIKAGREILEKHYI